jgi:cell division initiation protein
MLTPQEVSSHAFAKAVMGGYNMAAVDEFLDVLTDDYTNLYKENAALKSKLKVLVEKVEEYRATEDSMRATLLTAQRMADSIVKEAETKRDEMLTAAEIQRDRMLADAESGAKAKIVRYEQELSAAEARMQKGQQDLSRFINEVRDLCLKELAVLDLLPQAEVSVAVAEPLEEPVELEPQVNEIEEKVLAAFAAESAAEQQEAEEPVQDVIAEEKKDDYPEGNPFEDALGETRVINLSELKFGRNYTGEED